MLFQNYKRFSIFGGIPVHEVPVEDTTAVDSDVLSPKTFFSEHKEMRTGTLLLDGTAIESDVLKGKTYHAQNSKVKKTGTLELTGTAGLTDVLAGVTFYNTNPKSKQTGTLRLTGNASVGDVVAGKTFYNTNPKSIQTGTLTLTGTAVSNDVVAGKTFYNTDAQSVVTGTLRLTGTANANDVIKGKSFYNTDAQSIVQGALTLTGTANADDVLEGDTFYNTDAQSLRTGTLKLTGNASASDVLSGKTFYSTNPKSKQTGTIPLLGETTYTPTTSSIILKEGQYLSGAQTVEGDVKLVPANIKYGTSIFGVDGTFTADANATANQILQGKTAYVDGVKVTGNIPSKARAVIRPDTVGQVILAGQYLSGEQIILGDANLVPENIADGVSIFGVTGTHSGGSSSQRERVLIAPFYGPFSESQVSSDLKTLRMYLPDAPSGWEGNTWSSISRIEIRLSNAYWIHQLWASGIGNDAGASGWVQSLSGFTWSGNPYPSDSLSCSVSATIYSKGNTPSVSLHGANVDATFREDGTYMYFTISSDSYNARWFYYPYNQYEDGYYTGCYEVFVFGF